MNCKEVKAWMCSCCGKSYLNKSSADACCIDKPAKVCDVCGKTMDKTDYHTVCSDCRAEKDRVKELERYNNATHYTLETAPKDSIEYMFSTLYPYNEGYISDFEDIMTDEIKYVYGTRRISPSYDAQDIVVSMLDECYEDAVDNVCDEELNKLQEAVDTFISNHKGCLDWYEVDYNIIIDIE